MITYKGDIKNVILAIEIANDLLMGANSFYLNIEQRKPFDLSNVTAKQVAKSIRQTHIIYEVEYKLYRPWYRWSKAIGYYSKKTPNRINANIYKIKKMSVESIVANIVHEFVHLTDNFNGTEINHHHSSKVNPNSNKGKENTAPYWIGALAKKITLSKYK
jgi:hypothetical protein